MTKNKYATVDFDQVNEKGLNARGNVREAIAALQAAGRFEENEELVNGAARHLADLLVAIQKAGVAA